MKKSLFPSAELFSTNEVEIHFKRPLFDTMYHISQAKEVLELINEIHNHRSLDVKEHFWLISLTSANRVLSVSEISIGTINTTCVNIREVFQIALKTNAYGLIAVHSHPSGSTEISRSDSKVTESIKYGCKHLGLILLDHIIITSETFVSMATEGKL
jgi:DNA repair protein RadC